METLSVIIPLSAVVAISLFLAITYFTQGYIDEITRNVLAVIFCLCVLLELCLVHMKLMDKTGLFDPKIELYSEKKLNGIAITTNINIGKSKSVTIALPELGALTFGYEQLCHKFMSDKIGATYQVDYNVKWYKYTYPSGKIEYKRRIYVNHPYGCDYKRHDHD